jgi:hypothetical protein
MNSMPVNKIFWFVSLVTVIFLGLQVLGYPVLPGLMALMIIDIIVLKVITDTKGHSTGMRVITDMNSKLANIHSVLMDMGNFLRENRKGDVHMPVNAGANMVTLGAIEKTLNKHKDDIKDDFKSDVDKIAEKIIDVENRLFDMRKGFSAAIAAFDDRMRSLEEGDMPEEQSDDYVEI